MRKLYFLATGGPIPGDTYNVTLTSSAAGFVNTAGTLLDGNVDGVAGGNFTAQLVVPSGNDRLLSLPDFARGPRQSIALGGTTGIPIRLDSPADVTRIEFTLRYDTTRLTISAATLAAGMPAGWTASLNTLTPGSAVVTLTGATPLSGGPRNVVVLGASVPATATRGDGRRLRIESAALNGGLLPVRGDEAVQLASYFGDTTGDADYSGLDASLLARVAVGLDSGFDATDMVDPRILGDVTGNGAVTGLDASYVARKAIDLAQPEIPDLPAPPPLDSLALPAPEAQSSLAADAGPTERETGQAALLAAVGPETAPSLSVGGSSISAELPKNDSTETAESGENHAMEGVDLAAWDAIFERIGAGLP